MWVWTHCLSNPTAPCDPKSWADIAEMFAVFLGAIASIPALYLLLQWAGSLFEAVVSRVR